MRHPKCRRSDKALGLRTLFLGAQQRPLSGQCRPLILHRIQITTSSISLLRRERRMRRLQPPKLASEPTTPVRSAELTRLHRHLRQWPSGDLHRRQKHPSWGLDNNRRRTLRPVMQPLVSPEPRLCKVYKLRMLRHSREPTNMRAHNHSRDIGRGRQLSSPVLSRMVLRPCTRGRRPLAPNSIQRLRQRIHQPKERNPRRFLRMHWNRISSDCTSRLLHLPRTRALLVRTRRNGIRMRNSDLLRHPHHRKVIQRLQQLPLVSPVQR